MKKRVQVTKKGNVVLFPDLEKRLLEKGLEQLKQKKFQDAIEFLSKAKQLTPDNEDIYSGLVLAHFEAGNFTEAKQMAKEMLQSGIGDYFQIVDLYIMILVQQNEYTEIVSTIEALFEEKEVPAEKYEQFSNILQFSKKMIREKQDAVLQQEEFEAKSQLRLDEIHDSNEQIQLGSWLSERNARNYMEEIAAFLRSEKGNPFFKTILLNILKEQDYEKEITLTKFGQTKNVVPNKLTDFNHDLDYNQIRTLIATNLENDNPMLFELMKQLMERYFIMVYPFSLVPDSNNAWAAAFHYEALAYFGEVKKIEKIAKLYDANVAEVREAVAFIQSVEQISCS